MKPYYQQPGFRLFHSNCLLLLPVLARHDVQFDLVFADPPYHLGESGTTCKSGKRVGVSKGKWDAKLGIEAEYEFARKWLTMTLAILKPSSSLFVCGNNTNIWTLGYALQTSGYKILNTIVWQKPNPPPNLACRMLTHSHELILWAVPASRPPLKHTYNYDEAKTYNDGKQLKDVWTLTAPAKGEKLLGNHPTQKPLALLDRIIRLSTNPGDLVLDPFVGSGTTGLAATELECGFVGCDMNLEYLNLAIARYQARNNS